MPMVWIGTIRPCWHHMVFIVGWLAVLACTTLLWSDAQSLWFSSSAPSLFFFVLFHKAPSLLNYPFQIHKLQTVRNCSALLSFLLELDWPSASVYVAATVCCWSRLLTSTSLRSIQTLDTLHFRKCWCMHVNCISLAWKFYPANLGSRHLYQHKTN